MTDKLRNKASNYLLWYDQARLAAKNYFKENSLEKIRQKLATQHYDAMIEQAFDVLCKMRNLDEKNFKHFTTEQKNSKLPIHLKLDKDIAGTILAELHKHNIALSTIPFGTVTQIVNVNDMELFNTAIIFYDSLVIYVAIDMLYHSELMLLDATTAKNVLNSNNEPLKGEDLQNLPFDRIMVEFSEPIILLHTAKGPLKASAVSFYRNMASQCYIVTWYADVEMMSELKWKSYLSIIFSSSFDAHLVMDAHLRQALNVDEAAFDIKTVGALASVPDSANLVAYNAAMQLVRDQIFKASRNIWDFITCRNIDYVQVERPEWKVAKIKKYRHIPNMEIGPRLYRIIEVNRVETDQIGSKKEEERALPYRESIPGCFHKWVFCASCSRAHRHDLIGKPCRRCGQQVGPMSNITIKKFWHSPYWRGPEDAPIKETVRELKP